MLLEILIPTYNREKDLLINLGHLRKEIRSSNRESKVNIIISDNCSTDNTNQSVEKFIRDNPDITIKYFRQPENVGLEKNVVTVLEKATAPHVMFVGDDDLIDEGYLNFCLTQLKAKPKVGCIISGLKSVNKKGEETVGRIEAYNYKYLDRGYDTVFRYSHLAHQMSGLVFKNDKILSVYLSNPEFRNPYLFIFFAAYNLLHYNSIYAPFFKTAVQVENEKDWGYNNIGLLDEVFKSYFPFIGKLTEKQVAELMIQFIRMHSYRLDFKRGPWQLYQLIIQSSPHVKAFKRKLFVLLTKEYILRILG